MTATTASPVDVDATADADRVVPPRPRELTPALLVAGLATVAVAALVGLAVGPVPIDAGAILRSAAARLGLGADGLSATESAILWELRAPRVALGLAVGALLGGSGAAYQGVFRNPLADPYLLGVAAGAGLGATLAIVTGASASGAAVPPAAFAGALLAVGAAAVVRRRPLRRRGGVGPAALILAGVAVAALLAAVQTYLLQRYADSLRVVYGWLLGRLSTAGWDDVLLVLPYLAVCAVLLVLAAPALDVLAVGDEEAATLGVRPGRTRALVVAVASLGTAAAVSVSGLIGFVGLLVPHGVRLLAGTANRRVVPLSMLAGAAFLVIADLVARTVQAPAELPIGVITALVGAPAFLLVLRSQGSRA
jgi:iron complex transport system permease protein